MLGKRRNTATSLEGELYAVADPGLEAFFDRIARIAGAAFEATVVLVTLFDAAGRHRVRKAVGMRGGVPPLPAFCTQVCEAAEIQTCEDIRADARLAHDPFFAEQGALRFAAGAPLLGAHHRVMGTLCVFDVTGTAWTGARQALLSDLARVTADQIEARRPLAAPDGADVTLLAYAVQGIDACLFIADLDGVLRYVNPALCERYGHADEALVGQPLSMLSAPENPPELGRAILAQAPASGWQGELLHRARDGSIFPVVLSLTVVRDEAEAPVALIGMTADITERRAREEALRRYNKRLQALAKINASILQAQSSQAVAQTALRCLRDLVPSVRASVIEYDFHAQEGLVLAIDVPGQGMDGGSPFLIAPTYFERLGTLNPEHVRYVEDVALAETEAEQGLRDEGILSFVNVPLVAEDSLLGTLNVGADQPGAFTEEHLKIAREVAALVALRIQQERIDERRRRAEARTSELKGFYENILRELPIPVEVLDVRGRYLYLNPAAVPDPEMRDWMMGKTAIEFCAAYQRDEVVYQQRHQWVTGVVARKAESEIEEVIRSPEGEVIHLLRVAAPVFDLAGAVTHVVGYSLDLTEAKQYEHELIAAKEHAEEVIRLKAALLANMSHEVRTPLAAIIGFSDILVQDAKSENREFARLIRKSGRRLMETLNAVLDLSQMEGGALTLHPEQCDLMFLIQEALDLLTPEARERDIWLRFDPPKDQRTAIYVDYMALRRVLHHLLANALKFTHSGGVTLALRADATHAEIRVEDTGIGIADHFLPKLFDAFTQESNGIDRSFGGIGIGLAIAHRLVTLMGGELTVETTKGVGSVFTVRVPHFQDAAIR